MKNVVRVGMGITGVKREDMENIFEELKRRGEAEEARRKEFVDRTMEKLQKELKRKKRDMAGTVKKVARKVLKTSRDRLDAMNRRIDELIQDLEDSKKAEKAS